MFPTRSCVMRSISPPRHEVPALPIKGLSSLVRLGASPRATIALTRIGQAKALLSGRDYVVPEDLKAFAHEVLRHRIMLTFEALADGVVSDQIVDKIVETVPVP